MKRWMMVGAVVFMATISIIHAGDATKSALSAKIKIGTAMENREVVGEADSFPVNTPQLVGWSQITGATEPTEITHVWKLNGTEIASVSLKVPSSPFRTYSRKMLKGAGTYTLEVKDSSGKVIASKDVEVK